MVENAKAEVAALHVKTENLVTKLREAELQNEANQARLKDFKANLDTSKGGTQECTYIFVFDIRMLYIKMFLVGTESVFFKFSWLLSQAYFL